MPPAPGRVTTRPFVLKLGLGLGSLIPEALLVVLELDPGPAGDVEHAPDGDQGRQEDDGVEDDEA